MKIIIFKKTLITASLEYKIIEIIKGYINNAVKILFCKLFNMLYDFPNFLSIVLYQSKAVKKLLLLKFGHNVFVK